MKLRAVTLENVRRFAGKRLSISEIGDGITVLAQPNEFGKSTIADALRALFFERYGAAHKDIKALRPHSGGAVSVRAEIETGEGLFEVAKQWLTKPMARVTALPSGRIIAADDEAEAWIARMMGGDGHGSGGSAGLAGPAGLLWVRQGQPELENAGGTQAEKTRREADRATRRSMLGEVLGGEIEAITGGRRMESVGKQAGDALALLATSTMKPFSKGPWGEALKEAEELRGEVTELDQKAESLRDDLAARGRAQAEQADLQAPEAAMAREVALRQAQAALAAAEGQAAKLAQAEQALKMAGLARDGAARDLSLAKEARGKLAQAKADLTEAERRVQEAEEKLATAVAAAEAKGSALTQAEAKVETARAALETTRRAEESRRAAKEAAALDARLQAAEAHRKEREDAEAQVAASAITRADVVAAEEAEAQLRQAEAESGASAVGIVLHYDDDRAARAQIGGAPVEGGRKVAIAGRTDIVLPGIGRMTVEPAQGGAAAQEALEQAQAARRTALAKCGADTLAAARARLDGKQKAEAAQAQAQALLESIAPEGLAALRAAIAKAKDRAAGAETVGEMPPEEELRTRLNGLETTQAEARGAAEAARAAVATAQAAAAAAQATRSAAAQALELAPTVDDAALQQLAERAAEAQTSFETAEAQHGTIAAETPNLLAAQAEFDRTSRVEAEAQKALSRLSQDIARLNGRIERVADEGIEERLAHTRGRLAAAEARAARFETEARALRRLCDALDAARSNARDQFFGPILDEMRPLLHLIHPGATLELDDRSLLPTGLVRDGNDEPLDILSGGTREQIAILARLAFARLYARAGRSLPIILDDALVHSDDARIVAMFNALTMVAKDQQIIVLTCRQRAFQELGGAAPLIAIEAA